MAQRWTEDDLDNYLAKQAMQQDRVQNLVQPIEHTPEVSTGKSYSFTVFGEPIPAGSKQAYVPLDKRKICTCDGTPVHPPYRRPNGGVMIQVTNDNKRVRAWMNHISRTAREEYSGPLLTGFVSLECVFYLPRPKGHFGTGANEHRIKPSAQALPGVKPDVDKLLRAVSDGLTQAKNVYADDALIVDSIGRKRYGNPRVEIVIQEIMCEPNENQPELFQVEGRPPWEA
jgi:Holliday junction resolvase RusA-like endonuclease